MATAVSSDVNNRGARAPGKIQTIVNSVEAQCKRINELVEALREVGRDVGDKKISGALHKHANILDAVQFRVMGEINLVAAGPATTAEQQQHIESIGIQLQQIEKHRAMVEEMGDSVPSEHRKRVREVASGITTAMRTLTRQRENLNRRNNE